MGSKFGYMEQAEVTAESVATYTMFHITMPNGKNPVITGRIAGEKNLNYFNQVLKRTAKRAKAIQAGAMSQAMLAENRDEDRMLFPKYVITGWEVVDAQGKEVAFSPSECSDFLNALPDHVFDDLRNFFASPNNFAQDIDDETVTAEEAAAKGK